MRYAIAAGAFALFSLATADATGELFLNKFRPRITLLTLRRSDRHSGVHRDRRRLLGQ